MFSQGCINSKYKSIDYINKDFGWSIELEINCMWQGLNLWCPKGDRLWVCCFRPLSHTCTTHLGCTRFYESVANVNFCGGTVVAISTACINAFAIDVFAIKPLAVWNKHQGSCADCTGCGCNLGSSACPKGCWPEKAALQGTDCTRVDIVHIRCNQHSCPGACFTLLRV